MRVEVAYGMFAITAEDHGEHGYAYDAPMAVEVGDIVAVPTTFVQRDRGHVGWTHPATVLRIGSAYDGPVDSIRYRVYTREEFAGRAA